jgi:hypothetical protein
MLAAVLASELVLGFNLRTPKIDCIDPVGLLRSNLLQIYWPAKGRSVKAHLLDGWVQHYERWHAMRRLCI